MQTILLTNTLTGKKEPLTTIEPGHVRMYACGVTVYDHCHIGHAMQAIYFDVMRSFLEYVGYRVTYVRNFTDVDDKIIKRAGERGISPRQLSEEIIASSDTDMKRLGLKAATHEPKVSESIPEIIAMVQTLIDRGFAYKTPEGDVYYRVRAKDDYGKLSNRKTDELRSGTRDIVDAGKEDDLDFALWKRDETAGASWPSPWGMGRPGWHIECSAMARKYLGDQLDIHGGGRDLVFPHHENEIAQSEAALGKKPYARYWVHSGLLTIEKQKMSKSLGNHILISDFLKSWPAEVLRLAYVQQHYTSNTDFSPQFFRQTSRRLLYYYETVEQLQKIAAATEAAIQNGHDPKAIRSVFVATMSDDFNTPKAFGDLQPFFKKANELVKLKVTPSVAYTANLYVNAFREVFQVMGLLREEPHVFIEKLKDMVLPELGITRAEIAQAIDDRRLARDQKDYAASDLIRDALSKKCIELKDTATGTQWSVRFVE